ncbi:AAA-like domain-containing protein [Roseofilum sp. BLCC_M154]|uniref:AAA-like domain-containing protein n=1 Tax=Roseofilum acuticapitatum BLCC-M154 TaxID=3022444 RepID=A0ABT7APL0_9CYAN|nr:AAA-like domain-containing protein [Roseofilum acuticapitatum]MDJ1168839.1 AAA-like domain-containing protein [Roseofilum acuticapitatum BLCC-M154]
MDKSQFDKLLQQLEDSAPERYEILRSFLAGQSAKDIAQAKHLAGGTVRKHLSEVYKYFQILGKGNKQPKLLNLFLQHCPDMVAENHPLRAKIQQELTIPLLTGVVTVDSPRYVQRNIQSRIELEFRNLPEDQRLLLRIKGAQGLGKSSLLLRIEEWLSTECKHQVARIDLSNLEDTVFEDLETFLYNFTYIVTQAFRCKSDGLDEFWQKKIAVGIRCTDYLEAFVFSKVPDPKTLIIDGLDKVIGLKLIQSPFLQLLRSWHEQHMKKNSRDQQLVFPNLLLAYSTEPYAQYELSGSPLDNVGLPLELHEFTDNQIETLAQKYDLRWRKQEVLQLKDWLGGYPELLNHAFYHIKREGLNLNDFLAKVKQPDSPLIGHLQKKLKLLQDHPNLAQCFEQILQKQPCVNQFAKFQLEKAGLIKLENGQYQVRCRLYQEYFQEHPLVNHEG